MPQPPQPQFDDRHPYTIHFLDGRTQRVTGGDPDRYLTAYRMGPGQHVYETGGMPPAPPGHGAGQGGGHGTGHGG